MSTFKDNLHAAVADEVGMNHYRLRIDVILEELPDDDDVEALTDLLHSDRSASSIARVITAAGHPIGEAAVRRWQRRNR